MTARFRVRSRTFMRRDYGYVGLYPHRYQDLQRKRWWGWQTIDTEEVPAWVASYDAVGGCDWLSKFVDFGSWGRDGIVTPHQVKEAQ